MIEYQIREITDIEIEACIEVIRAAFITVADEFGLTRENCPTNPAFIRPVHLREDRARGNRLLGMWCGSEAVGFMQLEDKGAGEYALKNVAVTPAHRHKGYGKALLDYAKQAVRAAGGRVIKIGIIDEHKVLKAWYAANGFAHTGTKEFDHLPFTVGFMECAVQANPQT